ncbi:IS5 family transposase [Streptomyces sp. NPDC098789]|uniref:IS5 family transposase n=1 Tax=Streptomyces sp. NPDC098789 TaxID=3366098 RepID=UPI00381FC51D
MPLPRYRYPSDTSDLEWALLERLLPTPACQTPKGGAPEKWPRRRVVDAIRYITDNGAKWRALPADFGIPWRTVFGYFARWAKAGALKRILDQLRRRLRLRRRRCAWPVRVIVDSQSVKGAETVSTATRGYDANKHINGRKRHLIVDQDGLLVDLLVTPADVQDRDAARILLARLHAEHPEIVLVWADNGYGGEEFHAWAQDTGLIQSRRWFTSPLVSELCLGVTQSSTDSSSASPRTRAVLLPATTPSRPTLLSCSGLDCPRL